MEIWGSCVCPDIIGENGWKMEVDYCHRFWMVFKSLVLDFYLSLAPKKLASISLACLYFLPWLRHLKSVSINCKKKKVNLKGLNVAPITLVSQLTEIMFFRKIKSRNPSLALLYYMVRKAQRKHVIILFSSCSFIIAFYLSTTIIQDFSRESETQYMEVVMSL